MRVMVTGAAGFVGANLVRRLVKDGHEVHAMIRPGADTWRLNDASAARVRPLAIEDPAAVRTTIGELRPDWIFHLAAYGAYPTQNDTTAMVSSNIAGTIHLLDAAIERGFTRFVHTGTSSEYGFQDRPPDETTRLEPNSPYAVTKAAATMYCRQAAKRASAPVVTARLYSAYGPWEAPARLVPTLITRALAGSWPPLVAPDTARDFVFVDDVVAALCRIAEAPSVEPGDVVNVGSGTQRTMRDVVDVVRRLVGIDEPPQWNTMAARPWDTTAWVGDVSKAERQFGWTAATSLDAGLAATLAWLTADERRLDWYRQSHARTAD